VLLYALAAVYDDAELYAFNEAEFDCVTENALALL